MLFNYILIIHWDLDFVKVNITKKYLISIKATLLKYNFVV